MILTCNQQELLTAVSNVSRAVSSKSSIPALEGILLKVTEEGLFLCGYDLELGITTYVPARADEKGAVVFSAKLFSDIIRSLPEGVVTIEIDEKLLAVIRSGDSEFKIIGMAASEYPELPVVSEEDTVNLSRSLLKGMIRQTIFAVATNDSKPVHMGTLFQIGDGTIRLVAVDGFRLAMRTEAVDTSSLTENLQFVVPGKTLGEVVKLISDNEEPLSIFVGRRHIAFKVDNYSVISRLLDGDFLNYKAAIPANCATELIVPTRRFIEGVERMSLVINDRMKSPVRCRFEKNTLRLSCETAIGGASDRFAIENNGDELEIGFSNRYLLDALRASETDEVKIQLNGALSPMKIVPKEGESFLFLVLPVRLKG